MNDAVNESATAADPPGGRAWWLWPVDLALVVLIGCVAAMLIGAVAAPFSEQTLLRMAFGNVFFSAIVGFQFLLMFTLPSVLHNRGWTARVIWHVHLVEAVFRCVINGRITSLMSIRTVLSIRTMHLCAGILLLAGCAPSRDVTEAEYLRNLSIQTSVNQADPTEFVVSVDTGVQDPELWERYRVSLITSEGEHSLGEVTSILGAGGMAYRVPVDSVPGVDLSQLNVQVEYAVYRGEPTDGEMLFSGTVGIEAEHSLDGPQSDEPENSGESPACVIFAIQPRLSSFRALPQTVLFDLD